MAVNFTPLLKRLAAKGVKPNTPAARNWFRTKVRDTRVNRQKLMSASDRLEARPQIGSMYCYAYDPKWKKKLEYYDEFPLIFVVEPSPGGFIGINLHYVSPRNRIVLMDSLTKISTDKNYNKKTKLALSCCTEIIVQLSLT